MCSGLVVSLFFHICLAIHKCKQTSSDLNKLILHLFSQRLMDTLSRDDAEVRRRLSDLTRRITVYRVNEKALTRRYQTMEETDGQLRKVREREVSEYLVPLLF